MLLLAKAAAIAVLVWFYMTAKKKGEPAFQWAIIGLVGYWIAWGVVEVLAVHPLRDLFPKNYTANVIISQLSALCAIGAAYLIRKKLLADSEKKSAG